MVDQVTKSGFSIFIMGCAGYAFGHLNSMDPKITALVWMIADLSKHIFDYIAIQRQAADEDFSAIRGGTMFFPPLALAGFKQFPPPGYATAFLCFFSVGVCLFAIDGLSAFAGRTVHPIPAAPAAPPPPPQPPV